MTNLPTLYTKTSTGATQQWSVWGGPYQDTAITDKIMGAVITEYGQVGGAIQKAMDILKEGKNIGKKTETTPAEQAAVKAKQLWDKKVKEGYVTDITKIGNPDLPGIDPMLAFPIEKKEKYVKFPAIAQPKLDGFRGIAVVTKGKAKLFSRTRKEVTTLPHIVKEIEELFDGDVVLDGEFYNHELKHDFNRLASLIKRDEVHPDHTMIQYHIYDVVDEGGYKERTAEVFGAINFHKPKYLVQVKSRLVNSREELNQAFVDYLADNYEGAMYRKLESPYENDRSPGLLKVKEMDDAEFEVVGVEEGSGKLMGKAGSFILKTPEGKTFNAKMKGSLDSLTEFLVNFDKYKGKMLTVQFQGLTPDGIPRFPVGVRFRIDI